jgi:hypothetical protein
MPSEFDGYFSDMSEQESTPGVPAAELSNDDLARELEHAHSKRHDIFVDGTAEQLRNLQLRTRELERAYLERFADQVAQAAAKLRSS